MRHVLAFVEFKKIINNNNKSKELFGKSVRKVKC